MMKFKHDVLTQTDKKRADSVEEWLDLYPNILNVITLPLAYLSYDLRDWLKIVGENSPLSRDKSADWERCFRQPPDWRGFLVSLFESIGEHLVAGKKFTNPAQLFNFDFAQAFNDSSNRYEKFLHDVHQVVGKLFGLSLKQKIEFKPNNELLHLLLAEFRQDATRPPLGLEKKLRTPEFLFLFEISLPCWFNFQETVEGLLDKVKRDPDKKFRALQKLLQLDRGFLQNAIVNRAFREVKDKRCLNLLSANLATGMQYEKLETQEIKYTMIALIMELQAQFEQAITTGYQQSVKKITRLKKAAKTARKQKMFAAVLARTQKIYAQLKGVPLTFPAVRNLFDIIAREKNNALERDQDFPTAQKSFANAIKRYKKFWAPTQFFPPTPSKKVAKVRER